MKNHLAPNTANIQLKPTVANYTLYWQTGGKVWRGALRPGWWLAIDCRHTNTNTHACMKKHVWLHTGDKNLGVNRWM